MVPHAPTMNTMNHGNHISSFQFPHPRPADGTLLSPPSNDEYVPQYVNDPAHGYLDSSRPYTTNKDTLAKENVNKDVNLRRKKTGNCEPRGPRSNRQR